MKNKGIFFLFIVSVFFIQCQATRKDKETPVSNQPSPKDMEKRITQNLFSIEGIYFPDEFSEDCDFWVKIHSDNNEYNYTFFNGFKPTKTGKLFLKDNGKDKQLSFDNDFRCKYTKDTILIQNHGNSMNDYERIVYCDFKFIRLVKDLTITHEHLTFYNDKAYYLEQSGLYEEAINLLEKIINQHPNRTVAYINLGDAYWGLGNKDKAQQTYKTYVKQMKANAKGTKIPKQVLERIEE